MEPFYCAAPWRGLHINFRGDVKTCCAGNPNMLGDLNHDTISGIINGPVLREIKETIRSGSAHPVYCSNCVKAERYGRSERHWHNDVNSDFDVASADLDDFDPTIVDIRWNTTCNLSCNYCGEFCSSKWMSIKKGVPIKNGARPYYEQVCDFLQHHASDIREVALVGGEPLLLPENERLLDVIPRDCIVTLITNTSVDLEKNPIFKKLRHRNRVGWSMSFDNIGQRFEYVRHGSTWSLLNQNIDTIQQLMKDQGHWGGIHAVYNVYNCTRLVEFRRWAHEKGLTIVWQNLFQPEYLDPMQHGSVLRGLAKIEAQRLLDECDDIMADSEKDFFRYAVGNLDHHPTQADRITEDFRKHIQDTEHLYHPDQHGQFGQLWPEIHHAIKDLMITNEI